MAHNQHILYAKKQKYETLRAQLDGERSTFKPQWRDLNDFILPRRGRFFVSDANKGDRRNLRILDTTPTLAARTLKSGMMSGITSPARPWFRLTTPDPGLADFTPVRRWLDIVSDRMRDVFLRSNLYNVLPTIYGDLGVFATAALSIEEDFQNVVRFDSYPIGSYMIAQNERKIVDVIMRDFRMTARQVVSEFGMKDLSDPTKIDWSDISAQVRNYYEQNKKETWVDIVHVIHPNDDYIPESPDPKHKRYKSVYYEQGFAGSYSGSDYAGGPQQGKYLQESGFDHLPVLVPRWETTGEDVWGTNCPGMDTLGDCKQLQTGEKRSLQAIEKMINPPVQGPSSLRNEKVSFLPGDVTYVKGRDTGSGLSPVYQVNFDVSANEAKQDQVRKRISRGFYEDLFLMLTLSDRREITAREIDERHEEKLLALGPVLEQLNQDLFDPLIDTTFLLMEKQGFIPEPPEELQGVELKIEYVSIMAEAQKMVGVGSIERFAGFVGNLAQQVPSVLDKFNSDEVVSEYGNLLSVKSKMIRSEEEVAEIRQAQAEAQQQAQQVEMQKQASETAKNLSQTPLEEDTALGALVDQGNAGRLV